MERHAQERQTEGKHVKHETPHLPEGDAPHVKKALGERSRLSVYRIGWFEKQDSGQRSAPWLLWSSPDKWERRTDLVKQAEEVKDRIFGHQNLSPKVLLQTEYGRVFRPGRNYGNPEERKNKFIDHIEEIMRNENITREKLAANGSIPSTKAPKLKDIQKNRKEDLEECAEELQDQVLMPLQKVMVACLIEAYRDQIGLGEWKDHRRHSRSGWKSRREWKRTVELANLLLTKGVVSGEPLDVVLKMARGEPPSGKASAPVSNRVPEAIANGLEAALKLYLPKKYLKKNEAMNENPRDYSRDRILEEAEPMYFSWRAARLMYRSAAQNESFEELVSRILPGEDPSSFLEDGPSENNSHKDGSPKGGSPEDGSSEDNSSEGSPLGGGEDYLKHGRSEILDGVVSVSSIWHDAQSLIISLVRNNNLEDFLEGVYCKEKCFSEKEQKSKDERDILTSEEFFEILFTDYRPSPGAKKVLESILKSREKGSNLREYTKIESMINKAMNEEGLIEEVRPNNPVDTLRKDIKREIEKKGFEGEKMELVWPRESQDPSKIVDLALKYSEYSHDD